MEYTPCDCPCHPDGYGPLRPDTCQACQGTGLVADGANFSDIVREVEATDSAVLAALREAEAEAAAEAVPDTFRRRVVDPGTPPCCATPQLCGGPHEGCDTAPGGEAAPGTVAAADTAEWSLQRLLSLVCDAPAPCPAECPPCVAPADDSVPCCPPDDFCPQCR